MLAAGLYQKRNTESSRAVLAMARAVLDEWRLAHSMRDFKAWLDHGAPSDDAGALQGQKDNPIVYRLAAGVKREEWL